MRWRTFLQPQTLKRYADMPIILQNNLCITLNLVNIFKPLEKLLLHFYAHSSMTKLKIFSDSLKGWNRENLFQAPSNFSPSLPSFKYDWPVPRNVSSCRYFNKACKKELKTKIQWTLLFSHHYKTSIMHYFSILFEFVDCRQGNMWKNRRNWKWSSFSFLQPKYIGIAKNGVIYK